VLRIASFAGLVCLSLAFSIRAQDAGDEKQLAMAVASISPHIAADLERESLRTQLGRSLREQIAAANRASSAAWAAIGSRDEWERFRREKLAALRKLLGELPARPRKPQLLVTGRISGEGFQIQNLVYVSRPGLVVTANLYVPDPPRPSMPGIVLSHSHHNPKHEGELQDMGLMWARAGCCVLVPDHLGHGQRRQHPFATAADYAGQFQVGRQDYYFRYDTSLQLYLAGETLMGWMVHDLMTGIDVLLAQPGIDPKRLILLGSVAGGGDPAAVTAALDERIACVVPFNFGGPQPETRYPLPDAAETTFNYAGSGSWESTRNLYRSAADGFLPWLIVGSVAPRRLVHAHEFSWDRERDPVWRRYQRIWGYYDVADNLAFTHGFGAIQVTDQPASHCNNIGEVHRRQIHEAFRRWFNIDVQAGSETRNRKSREELNCLTDEARQQFQPQPLHDVLARLADERLASARAKLAAVPPSERRQLVRQSWAKLLGNVEPSGDEKVHAGSPLVEQQGAITIRRELLETEPGIRVPVMTFSLSTIDDKRLGKRTIALHVATDGIAGMLERCRDDIAKRLSSGAIVVLAEVRGIGAAGPGNEHGQQSAIADHAATELMLGRTLLGDQLRDLRAVWRHIQRRQDSVGGELLVAGGAAAHPLPADAVFSFPRRIDKRPPESEPSGALLALLLGLFEDDVRIAAGRNGLATFRSLLDSPFVQTPLESIVPGVLTAGDLPDLVAALAPRQVALEGLVDGRGRLVPQTTAKYSYDQVLQSYGEAANSARVQINDPPQPAVGR
jgi:dienelactone hydrolase